jgi:hypothetical protein
MNLSFISNGYLFIPNFIDSDRAIQTAKHFMNLCKKINAKPDPQVTTAPRIKNYGRALEILCEKTPVVSDIIGEYVLPAYTYARVYKNGCQLTPHKDRASCEISLSVHLDGDKEWALSLTDRKEEQQNFIMKPGDAVLYLGKEFLHWRDPYDGEYHAQIFLHYVKSRGKYAENYFDRMPAINIKET